MKTFILAAVACIVGATAGALFSAARLQGELDKSRAVASEIEAKLTMAAQQLPDAQYRVEQLTAENQSLKSQITTLEAYKATSLESVALTNEIADDASLVAAVEEMVPAGDGQDSESSAENGTRRDRRGGWDRDDRNLTPEERAEREARREEGFQMARERMADIMNQEMAKYNDRASQERIAAINDQTQAMMDLWQQMREAQTDEDRELIRASIDQTRQQIATLTQEQQDFMLRDLAKQYGITSADKQDQFIAAMRDTTSSPIFRGGMGGFGMGFRGGGPGGGFGGGGR